MPAAKPNKTTVAAAMAKTRFRLKSTS